MIKVKITIMCLCVATLLSSCSKKDMYYEVQGTLVSKEDQIPLKGIYVDLSELGYFNGSEQKVKTDSLGRFIVRINSDRSEVHLYLSQGMNTSNYVSSESYYEHHVIKSEGTTTVETTFEAVTASDIVLVNKYYVSGYARVTAKITSAEVIYKGNLEPDLYNLEVQRWDRSPLLVYANRYIHYEITYNDNNRTSYTKDSL
ncbi:MAG: hypothetical protein ACJA0Q_001324, partial [Saprospiraceae bacterium]